MKKHWVKEILEYLTSILIAFLITFLAPLYLFQPYKVEMGSMLPTLHNNDRIMINKITYRFGQPQRGDIVVFNPPNKNADVHYIKRIVGLPGESIQVKDGKVFINQTELIEPYLSQTDTPGFVGPVLLKEDEYFVMGDHRNNSMDSRDFGAITRDKIQGKTMCLLWPMKDFHVFSHEQYDLEK